MSTLFLTVLEMSIHGSILIAAVILLRAVLFRAPRSVMLFAWALAAVRLLCPFMPASPVSVMPVVNTAPAGTTDVVSLAEERLVLSLPMVTEKQTWDVVIAVCWLVGAAAMLVYSLAAYRRTHKALCEAVQVSQGVYECDHIPTPFIFGLFSPRIYLPSSLATWDRPYVIAHERAHLARLDHVWKPLGFAVLCLHWFNPFVWVAYVLFCRDMESACDERVLRTLGADGKKPYADALISCASPSRRIAACPLAFGETDVKTRVSRVLRYKKPAVWLSITALAMCALLGLCGMTDPMVQALVPSEPASPSGTVEPTEPEQPTVTVPSVMPSYTQSLTVDSIAPRRAAAGQQVTVRATVEDTRGVKEVPELLFFRENENGEYITVGDTVSMTLVQGDAVDGIYEAVVTVPADSTAGDYSLRVSYIPVSNKPAICSAYSPDGEAALTIVS